MTKTFCDLCEKEINYRKTGEQAINISHTYGFGSPLDGETIDLDICETCLQKEIVEKLVKKKKNK